MSLDFIRGWGGDLEDENGLCNVGINPATVPPGYGIKTCSVCKTQVAFGILEIPGDLIERRSYCPRCGFLERFTMPAPGRVHTDKYVKAPGFMYYLWEFKER